MTAGTAATCQPPYLGIKLLKGVAAMGRRYRKRRSNSIVSVVSDVVHIASRLPWWGALLTGLTSYFFIAIILAGYIESQIASQAGSNFYAITEARFGRLVRVCNWVGIACLIVGVFFAVRNYFVSVQAKSNEKSIVSIISKLLGRCID
jgi:hypothetical protein